MEKPLRFLGMQLGRRMSVIRLPGRDLFVYAPAELADELRATFDRWAASLHRPRKQLARSLFVEQYRAAHSGLLLFAAPGLQRRRKDLRFDGRLEDAPTPAGLT